ncbi:GNAT family N-acetyltransferase [Spongiimicrobium salis]|uniref:GNAT family N-acetyltransferase n=1 Tax=Spongiimicrobium salis TaxID=1667022 RepID=UPI00374DC74E
MKRIRVKRTSDTHFQKAWELYEEAFPLEERRLLDDQSAILKEDSYHFDVLLLKNEFVGFILWWDFKRLRFIDHFATAVQQRNKGLGKMILNSFMNASNKPILLEVELPMSPINQRRIQFYERTGFQYNQHKYHIPAPQPHQSPMPLALMSYPDPIASEDVDLFVKEYHPILFKSESSQ